MSAISAHILPKFVRLLVSETKSPRVKKTIGYVCHEKWGDGSCLGNIFDVTLLDSIGIVVHQDHYGGHYTEKNSHPPNNAMKIQTPKSR
jgi:hypothetical protein